MVFIGGGVITLSSCMAWSRVLLLMALNVV
jgi:hypothetical protein